VPRDNTNKSAANVKSRASKQRDIQDKLGEQVRGWLENPEIMAALPDDEKAKIAMRLYRPPTLNDDVEATMLSLASMIEDSYNHDDEWKQLALVRQYKDMLEKREKIRESTIRMLKDKPGYEIAGAVWDQVQSMLKDLLDWRRDVEDLAEMLRMTPRQFQLAVESWLEESRKK
jgi:hypothetical protein